MNGGISGTNPTFNTFKHQNHGGLNRLIIGGNFTNVIQTDGSSLPTPLRLIAYDLDTNVYVNLNYPLTTAVSEVTFYRNLLHVSIATSSANRIMVLDGSTWKYYVP